MNLEIKKLSGDDLDDFIGLLKVFNAVFEMENITFPTDNYLKKLLEKPEFMVFVAKHNQQVIGGLTAYILDGYYSEKQVAYIYDLAIDTNFQRMGIGKKLISTIKTYCSEMGFEEMFVQAETVDEHAIEFYRNTGRTEELHAVHFSYSLKPTS